MQVTLEQHRFELWGSSFWRIFWILNASLQLMVESSDEKLQIWKTNCKVAQRFLTQTVDTPNLCGSSIKTYVAQGSTVPLNPTWVCRCHAYHAWETLFSLTSEPNSVINFLHTFLSSHLMLCLSIKWEKLDFKDLSCCNWHRQRSKRSLHPGLAPLLLQKSGLI